MGLTFTQLTDHRGPAIYLLGSSMLENKLQVLGKEIDHVTSETVQVAYLDTHGPDGAKVASFYGVTQSDLPAVLIVMDDDTLHKSWFGVQLPRAEDVAYEIRSITG